MPISEGRLCVCCGDPTWLVERLSGDHRPPLAGQPPIDLVLGRVHQPTVTTGTSLGEGKCRRGVFDLKYTEAMAVRKGRLGPVRMAIPKRSPQLDPPISSGLEAFVDSLQVLDRELRVDGRLTLTLPPKSWEMG